MPATATTTAAAPPQAGRTPRPCPFGPTARTLLVLLADGLSFEEIGQRSGTAASTAHRRTWKLVKIAGCRNRIHLVAEALRNGWIR